MHYSPQYLALLPLLSIAGAIRQGEDKALLVQMAYMHKNVGFGLRSRQQSPPSSPAVLTVVPAIWPSRPWPAA
jgi:hypothetical protein